MEYIYDKAQCTERFEGMVHGLAIFAALTNCWQFSFTPTVEDRKQAA